MQVSLPGLEAPAKIVRDAPFSERSYRAFCKANPDLRVERTSGGEIVVRPPVGLESSFREADLVTQLGVWTLRDGRGLMLSPSVQFRLPSGAARSPDAAWVSNERVAKVSKKEHREFPRLVPEFVVEVLSPSDRLRAAQRKMEEWMANGVELGWLIDSGAKTVTVYRRTQAPEKKQGLRKLKGEGPVAGFVLDLNRLRRNL